MSRKLLFFWLAALFASGPALADAPKVATDISPVHSLVARVMDGVGTPDLIVSPGASPHEFRLRPSQADALQQADIVFWVSHELTPWMEDAIANLADDATIIELIEADGILELATRDSPLFEAHAEDDEDHHDHEHGELDPHAWLSPENAAAWLSVIARQLSAKDPANAALYAANAEAGRAEIRALTEEIDRILTPSRGKSFVVFHDAYQYFEVSFAFPAAGAISLSDAADPGPARIAEIQARIAEGGVGCVLAEPQYNPGLVATVLDGTSAATGVLDPLGADLAPGPELYGQMMRNLATTLADCL